MKIVLILATLICVGTLAQFTSEAQDAILNVHNTLRSKIAKGEYVAKGTSKPAGSDMLKMKWDETLAASAQAYADSCPTVFEPKLGENIFYYRNMAPVTKIDELGVNASLYWEKEFQVYGWKSNSLIYIDIAYAAQMAWAKTNLIGCGVKDCGTFDNGLILYKAIVVCQYKPKTEVYQDIYTTGDTCSACPSGTTCESETGLCV